MRRWLELGTFVVLASAAGAQQPADGDNAAPPDPHAVQPERPTVATHAGTVAPGWLEIEAGVERDRLTPSADGYGTPVLFKLGLADRLQLGVFGSWTHPAHDVAGLGDIGVNLKWRLVEQAPVIGDFALLPSIKLPTGSAGSGTGIGTTDASLLAISSHDFGPIALDVNVGYTRRSGSGSVAPRNATLWTVSGGGPFVGRLGWALECYGYPGTAGQSGQPPIVAILGGPTFLVHPWLALDAGAILPVAGPQPHALYTGAVYNVGRIWGTRR